MISSRKRAQDEAKRAAPGTRRAVSNSFSEEEIALLSDVLARIQRGGDARGFVRSPSFASLSTKIGKMKARVVEVEPKSFVPRPENFVPSRCGLVAEGPPGVLGNTSCVLPRDHEGPCSTEERW